MTYVFEEIDQDGLDTLEAENFLEFDGMIFRRSAYNPASVQKLMESGLDKAAIQLRVNHQSLISYGGSVGQQLNAANRIAAAWLKRAVKEFPNLYPTVIVESSPQEILISIRAVPR